MPVQPRVGDHFGRYRIDDEIGRGGMGVVLGATDTSLNRRVALKVVSSSLGDDDEFRLRFEREAAVLARLDSPHVIAIFDYGTIDGCPYIATQYVGGGDLGARLHHQGPMPLATALRVCAQTADALHDAHLAGIVHRDVKPTNVLIRDDDVTEAPGAPGGVPHVYLCDFGIARVASDGLTTPGSVAGTWSYLAPECGRGAPATPASDVYAVGCLLWAALTGLPPYRGTDVQVAVAHQNTVVRQLPGDSPAVHATNEVLRRAMAKDPADRYPDADRLRSALLTAATLPGAGALAPPVAPGEPGSLPLLTASPWATTPRQGPPAHPAPPSYAGPPAHPGPSTPTPTPAGAPPAGRRRGRSLVAAAVVAVLVVGLGVAALSVRGRDDPRPADPTGGTTAGPGGGEPTDEAPGPTGGVTGDLDGDGRGDLSVDYDARDPEATLSTTWVSDGSSTFVDPTTEELAPFGSGRGTWRLRGDLDDDDTADVLTFRQPDRQGPVSVTGTLSDGTEVDTELPGGDRSADTYDALGDVDDDGVADLLTLEVVGPDPGTVVVSTWAFDGTAFAPAEERLEVSEIASTYFRPGDVDGDGVVDLVTLVVDYDADADYPARLELWLGDGEGGFDEPVTTETVLQSGDVLLRTGDFDGDGADEVLVGELDTSFIVLGTFDLSDGTVTGSPNAGSVRFDGLDPIGPDLSVLDVDGDRLDDVVSIGLIRPRRTGRALVGVSNGSTFTTSRWLAWDQQFAEQDGDGRFEILEDARW